MDVQLKHHYGWETHKTDSDNLDDAAKQAVRDTHHFLTDTNHTMDASERVVSRGGNSSRYHSVLVYRGEGAPAYSGPRSLETDYWFAVEYRAETTPSAESGNG
jgi:hypothetical protein